MFLISLYLVCFSPTVSHQPLLTNCFSLTASHQPLLINRFSPTTPHQLLLTNCFSPTTFHQPLLANSFTYQKADTLTYYLDLVAPVAVVVKAKQDTNVDVYILYSSLQWTQQVLSCTAIDTQTSCDDKMQCSSGYSTGKKAVNFL